MASFAVRFEHAEGDNTYRIDVSVRSDRVDDEARAAVGTLLIISNDRTEPRREVPLFGSGRINKIAAPSSRGIAALRRPPGSKPGDLPDNPAFS